MIEGDPFPKWFQGDEYAVDFAHTIWNVCQGWDDIIDDKNTEKANDIFQWIMFKKDAHPFYMLHAPVLSPALLGVFLQWQAANVLERGNDDDMNKAYMLRAGIYTLFLTMAWVIGGNVWASQVGPEIYRTYGETLPGFKKEMLECHSQQ